MINRKFRVRNDIDFRRFDMKKSQLRRYIKKQRKEKRAFLMDY